MSTIRSNFIGPLTGTSLPTLSASPVLMDAKAYNWNGLTTNTYLDFDSTVSSTLSGVSGIPTWAKRITVMFNGVSTNGTSIIEVRLGVSGVPESTGYSVMASWVTTTNNTTRGGTSTSGVLVAYATGASETYSGSIVFTLLNSSTNTWTIAGALYDAPSAGLSTIAGVKSLAGTLNLVRITTVNGTDTFDAGSVSVMYE